MKKNSKPGFSDRYGISLAEVVVAVLVVGLSVVPLLWVLSSSKTDTSKAINYLRAMELANEALEWANVALSSKKDFNNSDLSGVGGALIVSAGSTFVPASIDVATLSKSNPEWVADNLLEKTLTYSEQYNSAFFYRTIEAIDIPGGFTQGYLKRVNVTVEWAEGRRPARPDLPGEGRTKKIVLSALVLVE